MQLLPGLGLGGAEFRGTRVGAPEGVEEVGGDGSGSCVPVMDRTEDDLGPSPATCGNDDKRGDGR